MKYIIDLEATCWKNKEEHKGENEIIEIGFVAVDDKFKIKQELFGFVKPVRNPILSDFCKELTGINQSDIDNAKTFPLVFEELKVSIRIFSQKREDKVLWYSWGHYDQHQFMKDCAFHKILYCLGPHQSLKHLLAQHSTLLPRKPIGMKKALIILDLPLEGIHHRALDDAKNIAKIGNYEYENDPKVKEIFQQIDLNNID